MLKEKRRNKQKNHAELTLMNFLFFQVSASTAKLLLINDACFAACFKYQFLRFFFYYLFYIIYNG